MKYILPIIFFVSCLTSCNQDRIKELEAKNSELESQNDELQNELDEAQSKIEDYESKFDNIQSLASDGHDAISYFNWSYQLQNALDAFEEIEDEANY